MKPPQIKTGCVEMVGPDTRMDQYGNTDEVANPLPPKCPHCTFPNLDFVAQPYLLAKGFAAPAETAPAEVGNFLVRDRVRRILEVSVPDACDFHPTAERKTRKPTPWWLAVPKHILAVPGQKPTEPRCSRCGEPRDGYIHADPEKSWIEINDFNSGGVDVFKQLNIGPCGTEEESLAKTNAYRAQSDLPPLPWSCPGVEPPSHSERWTRRGFRRTLFFSLRLEQLLRKTKVRGQLVRSFDLKPSKEDLAWVEQKLALLTQHGLIDAPASTATVTAAGRKKTSSIQRWFQQYLKRHAAPPSAAIDSSAIENANNLRLPDDYKKFITTVGPVSFENINETEGFTVRILPPDRINFRDYRRGQRPDLDEDSARVDGVMFAETDHGDCFVFDVSGGGDYAVFWYDHESNGLEPFAENFAACIKRFASRT